MGNVINVNASVNKKYSFTGLEWISFINRRKAERGFAG